MQAKSYFHYYDYDTQYLDIMGRVFVDFFKLSTDKVPLHQVDGLQYVRNWFYKAEWWQVYNLVEFLFGMSQSGTFIRRVSFFLEREKAGYRVIRACFGWVESGGFPLNYEWGNLAALIRFLEGIDA